MEQLNRIEIRGRVGNARLSTVGDKEVCRFSVATNFIYHNSENVAVEETTWHNCNVWRTKKLPDLSIIKTGAAVEVVGRIRTNKYTASDGTEKYSTEVMVNELKVLPQGEPLTSEASL